MEAVLAAEPIWNFRSVLRCPGGDERDGAFGADVRFHRGARPCLGSGRKRGQHDEALGRSRGGFSTKIYLKTDFGGLPIAFHLTGGEASDSRNFETLLDIGPDLNPRAALGDKGYDFKSNRDAARQRGICPAIPYRSNTKDVPAFFPKTLYKAQSRDALNKLSASSNASAYRTSMREDGAELRLVRRACSRLHLDQNRPHSLGGQRNLRLDRRAVRMQGAFAEPRVGLFMRAEQIVGSRPSS